MIRTTAFLFGAAIAIFASTPAAAGELFGGLYVHDVKTPLDLSGIEPGLDVQFGYRAGRIKGTVLQPYAFAAVNSRGETSYATAGVSARFGRRLYVRPGIGLAIHNGSAGKFQREDRVAFGSRILFEPELGIGVDLNDRLSVEASLVHLSHARIFNRGQNPGIDNLGVRLNLKL
ncbi:MAG: acyloxyacyl hydrolase [Sphingomicrobium sp.]